ncbi:MAG: PQQ-binding-like beta-propeller repeat protein [Bacteroidota bacterium]|nr:PQQ-binding-like beta-propeller repeat protein [Bacteroidota bacterium]
MKLRIYYFRRRKVSMRKFCIIILTTFLLVKLGFSYSGTIISGKITTTNSIPVNRAKICFVNAVDTNRQFISLSDSSGNYIITITGVENDDKEITDFKLYQNYPNPFSEQTTITYQIKQQSPVLISIYNILGQRVKTFQQEFTGQNIGQVQWDGKDGLGRKVANGIYFYSVSIRDKRQVRKMLFIDNIITSGTTAEVFRKTNNYYVEDLYQDSSNVYTVSIENTDSTKPKIEPMKIENVFVLGDTVLNFQVYEAILKVPQWPMVRYDASGRGHNVVYPYPKGLEDTSAKILWRRDFPHRVGMMSVGPEGNVYIGCRFSDTLLYAFSENGDLLWVVEGYNARVGVFISIKDDGTIIISSNTLQGDLTAAYTPLGENLWKTNISSTYSSPAISKNNIIYFCTYENPYWGKLIALNSLGGEIIWTKDGANNLCSPTVDKDGIIYYNSWYDKALIALYPDGKEKWRYTDSAGVNFLNLVIDGNGNIYFYKIQQPNLYCLTSQGKLKWIGKGFGELPRATPAITPNGNIISYMGNNIYLYNTEGKLLWELKLEFSVESYPVIDNKGRMYFGTDGSSLNRFEMIRINEFGIIDFSFNYFSNIVYSIVISDNGTVYYSGFYPFVVAIK